MSDIHIWNDKIKETLYYTAKDQRAKDPDLPITYTGFTALCGKEAVQSKDMATMAPNPDIEPTCMGCILMQLDPEVRQADE